MEQDIEILEDYIELIKKGYCEDCNELCNIYGAPTYPAKKISEANEHLIKAYKELEEEKEALVETVSQLIKENSELKDIIREHTLLISPYYVAQNYIPVSLVEEKIEELENKYNEEVNNVYKNPTSALIDFQRIVGAKEALQKLLEKRK